MLKKRIASLMLALCMFASVTSGALAAETRAATPPTQYAPASYYNKDHVWACKSMTYTSYIFEANTIFTCIGPYTRDNFYLIVRSADGTKSERYDAMVDSYCEAYVQPSYDYYVEIHSKSGTIPESDGAWYNVSKT